MTNFVLILIANTILITPMTMLILLGGYAGVLLAPTASLATFPPSIQMLAGVIAAAPMSLLMGRLGRKIGFLTGALMAFTGGIMGIIALLNSFFWLLCGAHFLLGVALICFGFFRFAAGESVKPNWQPVAISFTLGSGLIAALVGPEIFLQTKDHFLPTPYAGGYLAVATLALLGCLPLLLLHAPSRNTAEKQPPDSAGQNQNIRKILQRPKVRIAILAAAVAQGVMVLVMTPTPLAMGLCGFLETQASDVIRWHVIAMFAPSFVTGYIIKYLGTLKVIYIGFVLLAAAACLIILGVDIENFYGALVLLGIGWNFGFIGGTSLLSESLATKERAAIQGLNDTLIALAATIMSFFSGVMIALYGWVSMGVIALSISGIAIIAVICMGKEQAKENVSSNL